MIFPAASGDRSDNSRLTPKAVQYRYNASADLHLASSGRNHHSPLSVQSHRPVKIVLIRNDGKIDIFRIPF